MLDRFDLSETKNYNNYALIIQHIFLAKRRLRRLRFLKSLQDHAEEFMLRPGYPGFKYLEHHNRIHYKN